MVLSQKEKVEAVGVKEGRKEIRKLIKFSKKLISTLTICKEEEFPQQVGYYARNLPETLAFEQEVCEIQQIVRKICTMEITREEAISVLADMVKNLEHTIKEVTNVA